MGLQDELTRIAVEKSPEKRLELLHRVTDLYFEATAEHSKSETFLFNDIMEKIVDKFSRDMRRQVSEHVAMLPEFPVNVVRNLANDADIDVARPVIRNSFALTDDDLVRLAQRGSQAHLAAIAGRNNLPEKVTDVLIDRGEARVVQAVTANHGARFSESGLDRLVEKSTDDVDLRELLVERPDLSPAVVERLLPMVSESLVTKLAERGYDVKAALAPDMIHVLRQRFTAALRNRKDDIEQVSVVIEQIRKGHVRLDDSVRQFAEAGRLVDVAAIVAAFARLDRDHVFNLIYRGQLQTILILCRSLDLSWPTLDAILAVRAHKQRTHHFSDPAIRADYEAIDLAMAQRAMRFMRVRQVAGAHAERDAKPQAIVA